MTEQDSTRGHHCEIHDLEFEHRTWCPQCEIEFDIRERREKRAME